MVGAVLMSGIGGSIGTSFNLPCADSLAVIASAAEDDIGPLPDHGSFPADHGCDSQFQK